MFFLIMQFLWKYIDDLMGKGLGMGTMFELLFYVSATLIPLALPLAILFSSIMTFGNLAENNELTALKSAGLSLFKIMRPMLFFTIGLSIFAFYFTNYILPVANLKQISIIYSIQVKKPAMNLTPGRFYNDIKGFSILVEGKNNTTGELEQVFIKENKGQGGKTIKASHGEMLKSEDTTFLLLRLVDGQMYESTSISNSKRPGFPFQKSYFKEAIFKMDLSEFRMQANDEEMFKREYEMMNFIQLDYALDSLQRRDDTLNNMLANQLKRNMIIFNPEFSNSEQITDSNLINLPQPEMVKTDTIIRLDSLNFPELNSAMIDAQGSIRSYKDNIGIQMTLTMLSEESMNNYKTAWHKKFTLSFSIIILFFIGAPLGAIIKRGGLGAPLVFATLFFLLYYVLTMMGENMVTSHVLEPWVGMWMSSFFLAPLGIFLTYKAANDSALFDRDAYKRFFNRFLQKKAKQ